MKKMSIKSKFNNYDIIIENNSLFNLKEYLDFDKVYVLIHDNMIPSQYVNAVKQNLHNCLDIPFPEGEHSKSLDEFSRIIDIMQKNNIKRDACIIALGGGVTGDLAGFIASVYLRGIEYIQIPTSLLAQIDSSIGGKVAINTSLAKNSIGSFYPPKLVLIDPKTLDSLDPRHFSNGISEMIKYGMIASESIFNQLNSNDKLKIEDLIYESIKIKKYFVENDEYDTSIRQALNFGHTYGHAYESYYNYSKYYHGEAVALGMILSTKNQDVKEKLITLLKKYNLPTEDNADLSVLNTFIKRDKKNTKNHLNLIIVNEIGKYEIIKKKL